MADVVSLIWAVAAFIGAISLAVYLWRNPSANLRLKHRDAEIAVSPTTPRLPPEEATSPPRVADQADADVEPPGKPLNEATQEERPRLDEAFELIRRPDRYSDGLRLLKAEAASEEEEKGLSLIAYGQQLAAIAGSSLALDDLRKGGRSHPRVFDVQLWLGSALMRTGYEDEADSVLLNALTIAASDSDRATVLLFRVRTSNLARINISMADDLVERARQLSDPHARARIYGRAASLYLKADNAETERAFAFYELALRLNPADSSLRFEVARAYSDAGASSAALLHYKRLLARHPSNRDALNNLGVACEALKVDTIAVDCYKESEALGNTLARSNLAWKLIHAGFSTEAGDRLKGVAATEPADKYISEALGGIAKKRREDEAKVEEIIKRVEAVITIRQLVGDGLIHPPQSPSAFVGDYKEAQGTLSLRLTDAGALTGTLSVGGSALNIRG